MARNRTRLFPELSDAQVKSVLAQWRKLGNVAATSYFSYFATIYYGLTDSAVAKRNQVILTKVAHLLENEYENPRLELKRWRELYKAISPCMRVVRASACYTGREKIDEAANLYKHNTVKMVTLSVQKVVRFDVQTDNPDEYITNDDIVEIRLKDGRTVSNLRVTNF